MNKLIKRLMLLAGCLLLGACAAPVKYDYTAFKQSRPKSIVVLPPQNNSPDIRATYSVYSTVTFPLAESGYYVFPVTLVDQTFKQNGMMNPGEMHQAPINKIREIFGADATLYIAIDQYGGSYKVVSSEVRVTAGAKLVDNRTGALLWEGKATASDAEGQNSGGGGIVGMLVTAVVKQMLSNIGDPGYRVGAITNARLLNAHPNNGILFGPRSPAYQTD